MAVIFVCSEAKDPTFCFVRIKPDEGLECREIIIDFAPVNASDHTGLAEMCLERYLSDVIDHSVPSVLNSSDIVTFLKDPFPTSSAFATMFV